MSKYKALIGLEMHCEISETKSKVFSSARNSYTDIPNCNVRPVDMGFPGVLPVVNKQAVALAIKASMITHCQLPQYMYFERKNYYYPDLPKGFQLTQETKPIPVGIYGYVSYTCNDQILKVRINNIHLEEDAASLDHFENETTIDYNRAGVPLLELVSEPDFHSADEAVAFLEHMRLTYQYADISEADTKKGQIRCDVNVSIMDESLDEQDPKNWGTKVEIKNINSFGGVRDAINYEIKRQIALKECNEYEQMPQQTRRWDEETATTIYMRSKADAIDYKYFVEPNIPKYKLSCKWLDEIRASIPRMFDERKKDYKEKYNLSEYDAELLIKQKDISDYYEECLELGVSAKLAANWVSGNIVSEINRLEISIKDFYLKPEYLKQIIDAIVSNKISSKQAKQIFYKCVEEEKPPKEFIMNMSQISNKDELEKIIQDILDKNVNQVEDYKNGKSNLFDYFVGQVMKETRGKASPNITKEILVDKLK